MKIIQTTFLSLLILLFIGCGENTQTPLVDVTSIAINESNATLYSTDTTQLTATVFYADGTTADGTSSVTWHSSDSDIATVLNGEVVGGNTNGGNIEISITHGTLTAPVITANVVKLTDYNISILNADANVTGVYELLATGTFEDSTTRRIVKNITWDANNSAIFSISDDLTQIEIISTGDTNISSILFDDYNTTKSIIYRAN